MEWRVMDGLQQVAPALVGWTSDWTWSSTEAQAAKKMEQNQALDSWADDVHRALQQQPFCQIPAYQGLTTAALRDALAFIRDRPKQKSLWNQYKVNHDRVTKEPRLRYLVKRRDSKLALTISVWSFLDDKGQRQDQVLIYHCGKENQLFEGGQKVVYAGLDVKSLEPFALAKSIAFERSLDQIHLTLEKARREKLPDNEAFLKGYHLGVYTSRKKQAHSVKKSAAFAEGPTSDGPRVERRLLKMPLARHGDITYRVHKHGYLSIGENIRMGATIAQGLAIIHERGLAHKDMKPDQVLVDEELRHGKQQLKFKLADFRYMEGLAQPDADSPGTYHYWCPEFLVLSQQHWASPARSEKKVLTSPSGRRVLEFIPQKLPENWAERVKANDIFGLGLTLLVSASPYICGLSKVMRENIGLYTSYSVQKNLKDREPQMKYLLSPGRRDILSQAWTGIHEELQRLKVRSRSSKVSFEQQHRQELLELIFQALHPDWQQRPDAVSLQAALEKLRERWQDSQPS